MRILITFLAIFIFSTSAFAKKSYSLHGLATNADTKTLFETLIKGKSLPAWIKEEATNTPAKRVKIKGTNYIVVKACKPHDCAGESIAVLYVPKEKRMFGVFSSKNETDTEQKLKWFSTPKDGTFRERTLLFSALTGSLYDSKRAKKK